MLQTTRRGVLKGAMAAGAGALAGGLVSPDEAIAALTARPPEGFAPFRAPGRVVRVEKSGDFASMMHKNLLWPKPEVARTLLERALTELTGASNLNAAMGRFIHPSDVVAIKPNGIAGQKGATMAANFEVILPVVEAVLAVGVKPENVHVYEQFPEFLAGTRVGTKGHDLPAGVKTSTHNNNLHPMPAVKVFQGIPTKFCKQFVEATAVIELTMMKDHSICGYTGCLKNVTHGTINNPEDHHAYQASPQIALLYNHPIVTSRVRLHIVDAFKIMIDRGPLDRDPKARVPHGSVYATTDPVAADVLGWELIDRERKARGMKTLAEAKRAPLYLRSAADLGLGVGRSDQIRLKHVTV